MAISCEETVNVEVYCDDEYAHDAPSKAAFVMSAELVAQIKKMAKIVVEHKLYEAKTFHFGVDWFDEGNEESPYRIEHVTLDVTNFDFGFRGYIQFTTTQVSTGRIPLSYIWSLGDE